VGTQSKAVDKQMKRVLPTIAQEFCSCFESSFGKRTASRISVNIEKLKYCGTTPPLHRVGYSSHLGLDHVELADAERDVEEDEDVRAGQKPKIRAEFQLRHLHTEEMLPMSRATFALLPLLVISDSEALRYILMRIHILQ
jgi:hypothetical protein